ncbi:MAG: chemotaxis protein CheX [Alphaproteobacteria bacterium]
MKRELQLALDDKLSQEISEAVTVAIRHTFGADVTTGKYEIGNGIVSLVGDVSGIIGMVQEELEGTLTLCFTFETMRDILPIVLGKDVAITHELAVDAVGEITNMIFGHVKTALNRRGFELKLGIPSVVTGRGHFLSHFHRGNYMIVPFYHQGQLFQVHVAIHRAPASPLKS